MNKRAAKSLGLSVYLLHCPVRALGPGVRVGLWCQGCSIHCPGCMTPESWDFYPERAVPVELLAERIAVFFESGEAEGLTISGGEPFDQPEALLELLRLLRLRKIRDILIYSGYECNALLKSDPNLPRLCAALVSGPFVLGDPGILSWRGSFDQKICFLRISFADRYKKWIQSAEHKLQLAKKADGETYLIGIPKQEDATKLKDIGF